MFVKRLATLAAVALIGLAVSAPLAVAEEKHPAIHHAIQALEKAKEDLQHADHDFGGHRVEAIEAIDRALAQLKLALKFDKK